MGLSGRKINAQRRTFFLAAEDFNQKLPTLRVNASGSIGGTMELGLSADANTATLEGGASITASRDLLTNPTNVYAGLDDVSVVLEKTQASVGLLGWNMAATNDVIRHLAPVPSHWDHLKAIRARVHAVLQSTTPSQVGAFGVNLAFQQSDVAWDTADVLATTVLNPVTNAYYPTVSAWANTVVPWGPVFKAKSSPISMLISVTRTATFSIAGTVHITGVEIEYCPRY